jgi:hypothetical protein
MKTHKTASSTVQNILMRYGREHDWNFVMMKVRKYSFIQFVDLVSTPESIE